jgi:hypothetical protein
VSVLELELENEDDDDAARRDACISATSGE